MRYKDEGGEQLCWLCYHDQADSPGIRIPMDTEPSATGPRPHKGDSVAHYPIEEKFWKCDCRGWPLCTCQSSSSSSSGARGLQEGPPAYQGKDSSAKAARKDNRVSRTVRGPQDGQGGIDETWQQHQSSIRSPAQAALGAPFTQPRTGRQSSSCSTAAFTQANVDDAMPVEISDNLHQGYQQRLDDLLQFYNGHASTPEVTPTGQLYASGPNQELHPDASRS